MNKDQLLYSGKFIVQWNADIIQYLLGPTGPFLFSIWHNFLTMNCQTVFVMPSSVVGAIKYDANKNILRVIYVSGSVYDYKGVPEKVYQEMKEAFSKGEFLNKHIKPTYEFEKIK